MNIAHRTDTLPNADLIDCPRKCFRRCTCGSGKAWSAGRPRQKANDAPRKQAKSLAKMNYVHRVDTRPEKRRERAIRGLRMSPDLETLVARSHALWAPHRATLTPPDECSSCARPSAYMHGHHENYLRPYNVAWLCPGCHRRRHSEIRALCKIVRLLVSAFVGEKRFRAKRPGPAVLPRKDANGRFVAA